MRKEKSLSPLLAFLTLTVTIALYDTFMKEKSFWIELKKIDETCQ